MTAHWTNIEPEKVVPKTSQHQELVLPSRYYAGMLYNTNEPSVPLWKQVLRSIKGSCQPSLWKNSKGNWIFEYIVIADECLARRVFDILVKFRGKKDPCLKFHLARQAQF